MPRLPCRRAPTPVGWPETGTLIWGHRDVAVHRSAARQLGPERRWLPLRHCPGQAEPVKVVRPRFDPLRTRRTAGITLRVCVLFAYEAAFGRRPLGRGLMPSRCIAPRTAFTLHPYWAANCRIV
jgi:hypothetical protein